MNESIPSSLQRLLDASNKKVIWGDKRNQYTSGEFGAGVSSCALASLNAVRVIYEKEALNQGVPLLVQLQRTRVIREILEICTSWTRESHLDVDEVIKLPLFNETLKESWTKFGRPDVEGFKDLLAALLREVTKRGGNGTVAAVITRPPEILTVFCTPISPGHATSHIFTVFDSHPRPQHPGASAFVLLRDVDIAAGYLEEVLAVDPAIYQDPSLQWQAELLGQFSAHCIVRNPAASAMDMTRHAYDLNMAVMAQRLSGPSTATHNEAPHSTPGGAANNGPNRLRKSGTSTAGSWVVVPGSDEDGENQGDAGNSSSARQRATPAPSGPRSSTTLGRRLERHTKTPSSSPPAGRPPRANLALGYSSSEDQASLAAAQRFQELFDAENARIMFERAQLFEQQTFECAICFETHPADDKSEVDGCGHTLCRTCMRSYIVGELDGRKYPIFCPLCKAQASTKSTLDPTQIPPHIVETIGLTQAQHELWNALQIAGFSVEIQCGKCRFKAHVDRADFNETVYLACPSPLCSYVWCKKCSQEIPHGPVNHSCDGTKELDSLMKKQGWQYCPGCRTPCERIHGCPHMECKSPGCNTHFCYLCGELMIQGTGSAVATAVSEHNRRCPILRGAVRRILG